MDNNTIARYALGISEEEHRELVRLTESLDKETRDAEEFLNQHLELTGPLALPRKVKKEIRNMKRTLMINNQSPFFFIFSFTASGFVLIHLISIIFIISLY